jgi:hypothetical protein
MITSDLPITAALIASRPVAASPIRSMFGYSANNGDQNLDHRPALSGRTAVTRPPSVVGPASQATPTSDTGRHFSDDHS